jgi:hypothetical protein
MVHRLELFGDGLWYSFLSGPAAAGNSSQLQSAIPASFGGCRITWTEINLVLLLACCRIILTTDVAGVGKQGDIKAVPLGYWRNYLLPKKQAEIASEQILA